MRRIQNNAEKDSDRRENKHWGESEKKLHSVCSKGTPRAGFPDVGKLPLLSEWDDYSSHSSLGYASGLVCMTCFITEKSRKNIEAKSITLLMMLNKTTDRFLDIKLLECRREEHY